MGRPLNYTQVCIETLFTFLSGKMIPNIVNTFTHFDLVDPYYIGDYNLQS